MKKIYLKLLFSLLFIIGATSHIQAQTTETFSNAKDLGGNQKYTDGSFTGVNNIVWSWTACQDGAQQNEPYTIDGVTPILRHPSSKMSATIQGGISSFSLQYKRAYTGTSASRIIEVYINGELVGSGEECKNDTELRILTVSNLTIAGEFSLEIKLKGSGTKNAQTCIDNFTWNSYSVDPSKPAISVTDGLNINFGIIETIGTSSETQTITVEGTKLTDAITATLSDKTNFSCTGDLTNEGGNLSVTYTPSELGEHTATITLSSTGAEDVIINLKGECKKLTAATIEELRTFDADNTTEYSLSGNAIVTLAASDDKNGINDYYLRHAKYVQDATGAILIDDANQTITGNYTAGDQISGLKGTLQSYNGMLQLIPTVDATKGTSGNTVNPIERTLETISVNDQGKLVKLKNVTIQDVDGGNGKIAFGGESGKSGVTYNFVEGTQAVLRIQYPDLAIIGTEIPATAQNITGVVLVYNSDIQIVPISIIDSELDGVKAATTDDNITIYSSNGKIYVNAIGGEKIELFNITGQKVAEKVAVSGINVLDAVYDITLVKVGSKVVKVVK
ncbi:DUF5689 domain-containing protein [uncultured Coprobacter sp.]|uniref:DUF5689 domain-containing protein n=2 Tax=Coprobacter TaxID=1348911 RepID=UPI00260CD1A2|nr:DUF5689 domain-containing protein [uncultured Coprobacter sp.]